MSERFAIYYAPATESLLWQRALAWLDQPDLAGLTGSARRYGFHATIKAPFGLAEGRDLAALEMATAAFAARHQPVGMGPVGAHLIEGFLALTPVSQPQAITDFAATVVADFEPFRQPLDAAERERRLRSPLSERQIELVDLYGYPYVLEQFQLHMTLTDRLPADRKGELQGRAAEWFGEALAQPLLLDRLVLFHEAAPGEPFSRLPGDYELKGTM